MTPRRSPFVSDCDATVSRARFLLYDQTHFGVLGDIDGPVGYRTPSA